MSGNASVPNTFQNAVTATGLQLDTNFTTVVAFLNDPTNRANYAADGAATNTVVLTFAPPVTGGYTAGLDLCWKWGVTNTGGAQLNANGLGNVSVVNPNGSALVAGQGQAGSIGRAVYDGTRAIYLAPPSPASAADVSAAVTIAPYVSPGRMQNHPGVAKAWCQFTGTNTGTITANSSYNVASIVRNGTGDYSITFTSPFADANYVCSGGVGPGTFAPGVSPLGMQAPRGEQPTTASYRINVFGISAGSPTLVDAQFVNLVFFGKQ